MKQLTPIEVDIGPNLAAVDPKIIAVSGRKNQRRPKFTRCRDLNLVFVEQTQVTASRKKFMYRFGALRLERRPQIIRNIISNQRL